MESIVVMSDEAELPRFYRAVCREREAIGATLGEAVQAMLDQLGEIDSLTAIVVKRITPSINFTEEHSQRLSELMTKQRCGSAFSVPLMCDEQLELHQLVKTARSEGAASATPCLHPRQSR